MTSLNLKALTINGAIAGILSVVSYILIIAIESLPNSIAFLLAMLFPILGIVFMFSLREFITSRDPGYSNKLFFVFGFLAFTICAIFLSAQIAVQIGIDTSSSNPKAENLKPIKESIRLVDMGMDVAWDLFIGTSLIFFCIATQKISSLKWWGIVFGILSVGLIALNVYSFPVPPAEDGLFDLGPFIGTGILFLAIWMLFLGMKMKS